MVILPPALEELAEGGINAIVLYRGLARYLPCSTYGQGGAAGNDILRHAQRIQHCIWHDAPGTL